MRTIETTAMVTADHTVTVAVPPDIPPGECRVVLVIENGRPVPLSWAEWKPHDIGLTDPNFTFRREDLYGDGDR